MFIAASGERGGTIDTNCMTTSTIKALIAVISTSLIIACVKEAELQPLNQDYLHEVVFHAGWAPETKTVLQENGSVWWEPGDAIGLFAGPGIGTYGGYKLMSTNNEPAASVNFFGQIGDNQNAQKYEAVYPYNSSNSFDGTTLKACIPINQVAKEGTFDKNAFISVAISDNNNLFFHNICSGIKFSVSTPGIERITIQTNDFTGICGSIINSQFSDSPYQNFIADCSSISIVAPDEVGFVPGKNYYAVILPFKNESGITIYYRTKDSEAKWIYDKSVEFKRGVFKRLYNKEEGLWFSHIYNSSAELSGAEYMVPEGVDRETITCAHFHVTSEKQTSIKIQTANGAPVYFEMIGTEAHYYTQAEVYEARNDGGCATAAYHCAVIGPKRHAVSWSSAEPDKQRCSSRRGYARCLAVSPLPSA